MSSVLKIIESRRQVYCLGWGQCRLPLTLKRSSCAASFASLGLGLPRLCVARISLSVFTICASFRYPPRCNSCPWIRPSFGTAPAVHRRSYGTTRRFVVLGEKCTSLDASPELPSVIISSRLRLSEQNWKCA